ncbi:MAG TPA: hypothetical protein VK987_04040 [Anaerolineae bacterium]|jgi:hypothetical protein|nr:hypothetical protein [Anaerolineae bacterium]
MSEHVGPHTPDTDDGFERLLEKHSAPTPEVAEAMAALDAARSGVADALDDLTRATQSALDVPAKIRRNPVKTAALVGGTGFLLAGGPRRVVRAVGRRILPQPRPDPYAGILPDEIEKVLKDSGVAKDPEVRRALNRDFADYLKQKGKYRPEPSAAASFWRTFDKVAGPLGTAGARTLVQRLMEAEQDRASLRAQTRVRAVERDKAEKQADR